MPSVTPLSQEIVAPSLDISGNVDVDKPRIESLEILRKSVLVNGNDVAKYTLPECYLTSLVLTVNLRSLRNLVMLRTSPRALEEFRDLAKAFYKAMPVSHRYLVEDVLAKGVKSEKD